MPLRPAHALFAAAFALLAAFVSAQPASTQTQRQLIVPGDRLGIFFHLVSPDPGQPYLVEPGDRLAIQFDYAPEIRQLYFRVEDNEYEVAQLSRPYPVQPDGTLRLIALGEPVQAAGRTVDQIRQDIRVAYESSGILTSATATVAVEDRPDLKHESLMRLFRPDPAKPVPYLSMPVPRDGRLNLPVIGAIRAAGMAVEDLSSSITARYAGHGYDRIAVTVFFQDFAGAPRPADTR